MTKKKTQGIVLCISGPSGVGKGTVIDALISKHPDFKLSVSMTTRKPRGKEKDGVEYYFCDKEKFEDLIEKNEILEFDSYSNEYYGTPLAPIHKYLDQEYDVILDITAVGALKIKEIMPDAVIVFILPPQFKTLEERLRGRKTEAEQAIALRLKQAAIEINYAKQFEYALINDKLEDTVKKLEAIVIAEKCKYKRQTKNIKYISDEARICLK